MDPYIEKIKRDGLAKIEAANGFEQGDCVLDLLNELDALVGAEGAVALMHYADILEALVSLNPKDNGLYGTAGSHLVRVDKLKPLLNHTRFSFNTQCILMAAAHNVDITAKPSIAWIYGEQLGKTLKHCFGLELDHFDQSNWRNLVGHNLYGDQWDVLETLYDFNQVSMQEFLQTMRTAEQTLTCATTGNTCLSLLPNNLS